MKVRITAYTNQQVAASNFIVELLCEILFELSSFPNTFSSWCARQCCFYGTLSGPFGLTVRLMPRLNDVALVRAS